MTRISMIRTLLLMALSFSFAWVPSQAQQEVTQPIPMAPPLQVVPGAVPGAVGFNPDPVLQWCRGAIQTLRRAAEEAVARRSVGDYERANEALFKGLNDALARNPSFSEGPFTARAIARALSLAQMVQKDVVHYPNGKTTVMKVLFDQYRFIENVSLHIDTPAYLQYRKCGPCDGHDPFRDTEFERKFIQYAKEQVQLVLTELAIAGSGYGQPPVIPVGSPAAFKRALSISAANAAWDLRESTLAFRYSCVIEGLESLAVRLADPNGYVSDVDAVNRGYFEARDLLGMIQPCAPGNPWAWRTVRTNTYDILNRTMALYEAQTQSVYLHDEMYIKNIYIQVEAYGRPAELEVFVNGELRSNIWIPATDPNYFIAIERSTRSIEFRHKGGGRIHIYDIKAVVNELK